MLCTKDNLDDFVSEVDKVGGPDSSQAAILWKDFRYQPTIQVDQTLDPYSEPYWQQQVQLYREITGRELNQVDNDLVNFDLEDHVRSVNAYASTDPARMTLHYSRLSKLIKYASLSNDARVLNMGCGWGMESEFFALMGCRVTAVDINEKFVELVRSRSKRLNLGIEAIHGNFDNFDLDEKFDLIVFYGALHHALKPWKLLEKVSSWLKTEGKIVLSEEPIQSEWWQNWGLRLDPLSIYCMRKFGWFESGWSKEFMTEILQRYGLSVSYITDVDPDIGPIMIGARSNGLAPLEDAPKHTSNSAKKSIATKVAARIELLRRAAEIIRQALSLSFLFRK